MNFLKNKRNFTALFGLVIGFANGLLGTGGGILTVPFLKKCGMEQKAAHTNAVAVILPITVLSGALYLVKGHVTVADAIPFIPSGLIGAVIGTFIIKKISPLWLKRIFGVFIIYAGIRLLLK
ncbi:MAG: sulfite exporter TauE/SafE family protein [Clostridia bacterium]|nr:sulfite exporter TauE/SafE family protein [Clostridia bacterium]